MGAGRPGGRALGGGRLFEWCCGGFCLDGAGVRAAVAPGRSGRTGVSHSADRHDPRAPGSGGLRSSGGADVCSAGSGGPPSWSAPQVGPGRAAGGGGAGRAGVGRGGRGVGHRTDLGRAWPDRACLCSLGIFRSPCLGRNSGPPAPGSVRPWSHGRCRPPCAP